MTYLVILSNDESRIGQIDVGDGVSDVWNALEETHPEMWDLIDEENTLAASDWGWAGAEDIATAEELREFLEGSE